MPRGGYFATRTQEKDRHRQAANAERQAPQEVAPAKKKRAIVRFLLRFGRVAAYRYREGFAGEGPSRAAGGRHARLPVNRTRRRAMLPNAPSAAPSEQLVRQACIELGRRLRAGRGGSAEAL